jgi:RNA polymerase sigma-70 factor (ECF subfamily)
VNFESIIEDKQSGKPGLDSFMDDERSLIEMASRGDAGAFCRLAGLHERWLFARALGICGNYQLAEDLAQETLVEAWKSVSRYDGTCRFSTWLFSILAHRLQKARRKAGRDRGTVQGPGPAGVPDNRVDPRAPAPAQAAQDKERAAALRDAVDALPEGMREVVLLRFFAHAGLDEIAGLLGVPLGTVKSRLHNALERLRGKARYR